MQVSAQFFAYLCPLCILCSNLENTVSSCRFTFTLLLHIPGFCFILLLNLVHCGTEKQKEREITLVIWSQYILQAGKFQLLILLSLSLFSKVFFISVACLWGPLQSDLTLEIVQTIQTACQTCCTEVCYKCFKNVSLFDCTYEANYPPNKSFFLGVEYFLYLCRGLFFFSKF